MVDRNKRLLAVFAHPDDESFGPGGTLAYYADQGVEVHLICATRGEAGDIPDEMSLNEKSIANLREKELRCAAEQLGLADVHMLDYRDSGMSGSPDNLHPNALAAAPVEEVSEKVATLIQKIQPQVIITFDPLGGYRHPDHIAIHHATLAAFNQLLESDGPKNLPETKPQKLYYSTFPKRGMRMILRVMPLFGQDPRKYGRNGDIDLTKILEQDFPIHASIDARSVGDQKARAGACHASQLSGSSRFSFLFRWLRTLGNKREAFMRAYPPAPAGLKENDLFAGIDSQPREM
jgi:LmbE family N-acetylglucosaminyl deacetylase